MATKLSLVFGIHWLVLAAAVPAASTADLRIEHVTIVSPERESPFRDGLVRMHDGRIVAIAKAGDATASSGKDEIAIDGSGLA